MVKDYVLRYLLIHEVVLSLKYPIIVVMLKYTITDKVT